MNGNRIGRTASALAAFAMLVAACTSSASAGSGASTRSAGNTGSAGSTGSAGDSLSTAKVAGVGTVLVNGDGLTLYYLQTDDASSVTCTGSCAQTWPADLLTATPTSSGLPGTVSTIANPAGGTQLTYDGWPLYTYSGDSAPGQANGQGVGGVWYAMTPNGAKSSDGQKASTGSAGSTSSGGSNGPGGYGY